MASVTLVLHDAEDGVHLHTAFDPEVDLTEVERFDDLDSPAQSVGLAVIGMILDLLGEPDLDILVDDDEPLDDPAHAA